MPEVQHDLKMELYRRGIRTKVLSDLICIPYDRIVRVLNGYALPDSEVLNKIRKFIHDFDRRSEQ